MLIISVYLEESLQEKGSLMIVTKTKAEKDGSIVTLCMFDDSTFAEEKKALGLALKNLHYTSIMLFFIELWQKVIKVHSNEQSLLVPEVLVDIGSDRKYL